MSLTFYDDIAPPLPVGTTVDLSVATVGPIRDVTVADETLLAIEDNGLWVLQADGKTIEKVSAPVEAIVALATDGGQYYIGADNGLFTGRDGEWQARLTDMISAICLQLDPPLYLAGSAHGMWRSVDGEQWAALTFPDHRVLKCTIVGSVAYAATSDGLYRSTDSGQTWTTASSGIQTRYIPGVAVGGGSVYAASAGAGLYVSTDVAATWNGLPGVPLALEDVTLDGGIISLLSDGTLLQSSDGGVSWTNTASTGALNLKGVALLNAVATQP